MFEETAKNTHSRTLYMPPLLEKDTPLELLKATYVKLIIKEVLKQKHVMIAPKDTASKGFPLSKEQ